MMHTVIRMATTIPPATPATIMIHPLFFFELFLGLGGAAHSIVAPSQNSPAAAVNASVTYDVFRAGPFDGVTTTG
jgi:hypothetical protein